MQSSSVILQAAQEKCCEKYHPMRSDAELHMSLDANVYAKLRGKSRSTKNKRKYDNVIPKSFENMKIWQRSNFHKAQIRFFQDV
jgi:hypothetical protein